MLVPRDYQAESAEKAIAHMRKTDEPGVLVLTTAAGKSIIVSLVSHVVQNAGKRVLCLAPNADLVIQNSAKYKAIGESASIFSASAGKKHTGHPVVFATPISVANDLDRFNEYALLIIDECHGVSEEDATVYQKIIAHLKSKYPKLRILGLTATPMRGKNRLVGDKKTFRHVIHELPHTELASRGWVVNFKLGHASDHYDLAKLKVQSNGKFKPSEVDRETLDNERKTRSIIDDAISIMEGDNRKCGMFFASSIKHAEEVLSYLPTGILITGDTPKKERTRLLEEVRNGLHKYVVNVATLTTGVDLPIVDTIVLLRATESIALLLQILGRGCRLYDPQWPLKPSELNWLSDYYKGKTNCLVLDYGQNIERFSLDDDLTITGLVAEKNKEDAEDDYFEVNCPDCETANKHTAQRCVGINHIGLRCDYRFIFKECEACNTKNSPSSRHCRKCDAELIDPNEKLTIKAAVAPGTPFYVDVLDMSLQVHKKGDEKMLRVNYQVTDGEKIWSMSEFQKPGHENPYHRKRFHYFSQDVGAIGNTVENIILEAGSLQKPSRLLVKKEKGSKYYSVEGRSR